LGVKWPLDSNDLLLPKLRFQTPEFLVYDEPRKDHNYNYLVKNKRPIAPSVQLWPADFGWPIFKWMIPGERLACAGCRAPGLNQRPKRRGERTALVNNLLGRNIDLDSKAWVFEAQERYDRVS